MIERIIEALRLLVDRPDAGRISMAPEHWRELLAYIGRLEEEQCQKQVCE